MVDGKTEHLLVIFFISDRSVLPLNIQLLKRWPQLSNFKCSIMGDRRRRHFISHIGEILTILDLRCQMFRHWKALTPTVDNALFDDKSLMIETREILLELAIVRTTKINTALNYIQCGSY